MWERAWANRIALWLRAWSARQRGVEADRLLGPPPEPEVLLTHDVDAVRKTRATRVKQSAFHAFNAARHAASGRFGAAGGRLRASARFALSGADYWRFPEITGLEERFGWRSAFHFYAGAAAPRSLKLRLMDPEYEPASSPVRDELRRLVAGGWAVGLHPSFDTWADAAGMARQREALGRAAGHEVTLCRQHWLRFSWRRTWAAQAEAGILLDTTLGFNDRPGFRNGAALALRPTDDDGRELGLVSLPLLLMDAHLYDYRSLSPEERGATLDRWLGELRDVRGQASLLWHQRVVSPDYGWDYGELLTAVRRNGLAVAEPTADAFA